MVVKVQELNVDKLFKIAKLNLHGKAKKWFKKLNPTPIDQATFKTFRIQKYENTNEDDIKVKLDAIK